MQDYLRSDVVGYDRSRREVFLACARRNRGILLGALVEDGDSPDARDCVYSMIARGELYVDLQTATLWEPDGVHVFADRDSAHQQGIIAGSARSRPGTTMIDLQAGDTLRWDTKEWTVANVGATMVSLVGSNRSFTEIPGAALEDLVRERRVEISQSALNYSIGGIRPQLAAASEADLQTANRRSCAVRSYLLGAEQPAVPARTLRLWVARFREAETAPVRTRDSLLKKNAPSHGSARLFRTSTGSILSDA